MPKKMFFNISESKRNHFLQVALEEFTSKPFQEVSVNTITKKANISRGSFYTYFDNLDALFNYIITSTKEARFNYAKTLLQSNNGDYFKFIRDLFAYDFDAFSKKGTYSLFKNYIYYIQITKHGSIKDTLIETSLLELVGNSADIEQTFQFSKMNLSKEEFVDLIEVIIILMINTFLKSESEHLTKEQTINLFNKRLSLLEYGVRKQ